jgi:hypothetical protein
LSVVSFQERVKSKGAAMWRKANLRRWIAGCKRHPVAGLGGFLVGLLYGMATASFNRFSGQHMATPGTILALLNIVPIAAALLGIAIFVWLAGTLRLPQKPGTVFVVCIFPGAVMVPLVLAIAGAITRTIA